MPSQYTFTDYSPTWPDAFNQEAERLTTLLGAELITVHHIGSTSVPNLKSKPIIDILIGIKDEKSVDILITGLERIGYKYRSSHGIEGRYYFTKGNSDHTLFHLHAFHVADENFGRHLKVKEVLLNNGNFREKYENYKQASLPLSREDYTDGKTGLMQEILSWEVVS